MPENPPAAEPPPGPADLSRRSIPIRPSDLPFFYLLLLLHLGILIALPAGAFVLAPFVRRLVALGQLPAPAPIVLLLFTGLVEIGFVLRARGVWRRLKAGTAGH